MPSFILLSNRSRFHLIWAIIRPTTTVRVHLSTLIHNSAAHRRFLRYAYAIFRPSGCVGLPCGIKHAVGDGLMRIADFGYFAQTAGSVSIRVSV